MQLSTAIPYMPSKYRDMTKKDTHKDWTRPDPRLKPISMNRPDPTRGQTHTDTHTHARADERLTPAPLVGASNRRE